MARLLLLLSLLASFSAYSDTIKKGNVYKYLNEVPKTYVYFTETSEAPSYSWGRHSSCEEGSQFILGSDMHVRCGTYWRPVGTYKELVTHCPTSHPIDNNDGTCSNNEPPEPYSCPDSGTFITSTWGRDGLNGWSMCRSDNCVAVAQSAKTGICYRPSDDAPMRCKYDLFYTGQACNFDPNNPGVSPPDYEYPDEPVTPPNPDNPPPSPDLPDEGGDVKPPIYDPDGEGDGKPDDPVQPPNPDPQPDPDDPNLSDGDNAIVGELSEANQRLENIDHSLQDLTNTTKSDNDTLIEYQAHLLGEMKQMNKSLADGVGGGGGGGGNGDGDGSGECEGDCVPVNFPGVPEVVDPFAEILDETDINDLLTRKEEMKTQLEAQMNNFKGLFRVPDYGTGGTIAPVEFNLQHRETSIPVKFGIFGEISADISSIMIMIAAFIAFLIVTTRR